MEILWTQPPRRFQLNRIRDLSGVSGPGIVASGVVWPDGTAAVHWHTELRSTTTYDGPDGIATVEALHGHNGATIIEWVDQ